MDLASFCLIHINDVIIQGEKTLKESKFDQDPNFESFKDITLSCIRILRVIKQLHQKIRE